MNNNNYKVTEDVWKLSSVTYNGKSSEELGLFIQAPPTYEYPERDVTVTHIPGRNGDLIVDNGCYKNVTRTYMLAKNFQNGYKFAVNAESVLSWLTSAKGKYVELTDDYESDVYMMATYIDRGNFTNYYNKALSIAVQFQCKPQKYLNSGKITAEFSFEDQEEDLYKITAKIRNSYNYEALPLVTVCWDQSELDNDQTLMLSVTNIQGDTTSSICINSINPNDLLSIDSELQTCYNQNGDANDAISLNGGKFPYLDKGSNKVSLTQYTKDNTEVMQYSKLISDEQTICNSKYASQDKLIEQKQDKVFIKSFDSLISSHSVVYDAMSYESLLDSLAKVYSVTSFNTLLNNYSKTVTINTDWKYIANNIIDGAMYYSNWLLGSQEEGKDEISLYAAIDGFFMTSENNSKNILFYRQGDLITKVKSTKTTTIYYYPSTVSSENPSQPILNVDYIDLPEWLSFEVIYKTIDNRRSPSEIQYKAKSITNPGWYWVDQGTGILNNLVSKGKSKWSKYKDNDVILNSLSWSTFKKAFMLGSSFLSTSTAVDMTYKHVGMEIINDGNTTVLKEVQYPVVNKIEPPFEVKSADINSKGIMDVSIYVKDSNWYSNKIADGDPSAWKQGDVETQYIKPKGTENFTINYLKQIPDYSEEDLWPDWLDPKAYKNDGTDADPNTGSIYFKVSIGIDTYWYRYTTNTENTEYTNWVTKSSGNIINNESGYSGIDKDKSFYIYRLTEDPSSLHFNNDRSYSVDGGEATSNPPSWLSATYNLEENTVSFTAALAGYFKWDNNGSWVYHTSTGESANLITINNETDITFYYMNKLPEYDSFDYVTVEHTETGDNPTGINIYAKVEGYFRVLGTADWKYYKPNDLIMSTTINQDVNILYLVENTSADLHNVKIRIKPRWWKL